MNSVTLHPSRILGIGLIFSLLACAPGSDGGEGSDGSAGMEVRIEMGSADDAGLPDAIIANHGFWLRVEEDPGLRTAPAQDAWERLKAYLERTLAS